MKRKKQPVNSEPILLSSGILLLIFSLFIPIPIILFMQDLLFFKDDTLSVIRHDEAFKGLAAAFTWLGIVALGAYATIVYADKKRKPYRLKWVHLILAFLSVPIALFSLFSYSSIQETYIETQNFGEFSSERIELDEVPQIMRHYEPNPTRVTSITFRSPDKEITIPFSAEDGRTSRAIQRIIGDYSIPVIEDGL
ncbi:hypothetical protein ACF3OH_00840 [Chryseomicrobium aureum]|uniref:hypothetical protein n=1 Tax=Chryseomicrobium aureum TaxID=1441723 RepID=UPI00370D8F5A